jgi:hypothetical protein
MDIVAAEQMGILHKSICENFTKKKVEKVLLDNKKMLKSTLLNDQLSYTFITSLMGSH